MEQVIDERMRRALACIEAGGQIERVRSYPELPGVFLIDFVDATSCEIRLPAPACSNDLVFTGDGFETGCARPLISSLPTHGMWKGFALFDDGSALRLDDPAGLRAFYRRARPPIAPLHLARLLARYHGLGEIVTDLNGDFARLELRPPITAVAGVTTPRVEGSRLSFCTALVRPHDDGREYLHLDAWHVRGLGGDLEWEVVPLARPVVRHRR